MTEPGPDTRPNIVMVITDDQPALDGRLLPFEPTVKSIFVDHGVNFTDFHSETPLCCPARAGFFTGQHTHNHNVTQNRATQFDPTETIATELSGVGYHTMLIGKYLNQYAANTCKKPFCAPHVPPGGTSGSRSATRNTTSTTSTSAAISSAATRRPSSTTRRCPRTTRPM